MAATDLKIGIHLSLSALSAEFGATRETVRRRLTEAGVDPSGKRGGHPVYRLRDVLKAMTPDAAGIDPDRLKPFDRHAHYKAEREKLHLEIERGDLVPAIEVEQEIGRFVKIVVRVLETLPDVVERDAGVAPHIVALIEKVLDAARDELYRELTKSRTDEDGGEDEQRA